MKINPFNPNSPVNPGMFVGRLEELNRLENYLYQTRAGHPINFIITGERGIGKSSLLLTFKGLAEGKVHFTENTTFKYLVIDTDINKRTNQVGLIRKIELGLREKLSDTEPGRKFLNDAWSFIQRVEAGGVKIHAEEKSDEAELILEEFSYALSKIINRVCQPDKQTNIFGANYDGVVLLIDEVDNSSPELDIGTFFKFLLERLQRRNCNNLMIGIAGLPEIIDVLRTSHPSSLRQFDILRLARLTDDEISTVINLNINKANEDNKIQTSLDDVARTSLVYFSEGYPHFIQQFGYSAFEYDTDNHIDNDDVWASVFDKSGALYVIGERYYKSNFYQKIQQESYRQVLRIMAQNFNEWISKKEIREKFQGSETVLSNALKALKDKRIILPKEDERGFYRLEQRGFALWIKFMTTDPKALQKSVDEAPSIKYHGPEE